MTVELSFNQFQIHKAANGQFCTIPTPSQPLANPPTCTSALYARNLASISSRCSLQIRKTSDVSIPSQIAPNVWILTTALSTPASSITLICPGKATTFIKVEKPIHILRIPTACSATSSPTPKVPGFIFGSEYFSGCGKSYYGKHFIIGLPCMTTP